MFRTWLCSGLTAAVLFMAAALAVGQPAAKEPAAAPADGAVTVLAGASCWRVQHSWAPVLIQTPDGPREAPTSKDWRAADVDKPDFQFMTVYPAAGFTKVGFDDSGWARLHYHGKFTNGEPDSRAGGGSASRHLRQLTLRGKFTAEEPVPLRLTAGFRGGMVVYLNGKEVGRAHMGDGAVAAGAAAELYPRDVYINPQGKPWNWWENRANIGTESYPRRVRRIEKEIPADCLRKGLNVLALEIHAAPYPVEFLDPKFSPQWATCGLVEVQLRSPKAGAVRPNATRPPGIQVFNTSLAEQIYDVSWADPHEKPGPIRIAAARNGRFSGRVVIAGDQPIAAFKASAGALKSDAGTIPAAAVGVRYGAFAGAASGGGAGGRHYAGLNARRDDAMLAAPPDPVPLAVRKLPDHLRKDRQADGLPADPVPGAVQPVYVTVHVPKDAPAGLYRGTLTLSAGGAKVADVPIELSVAGWALPDPDDFAYWCGLIQSPEGAAFGHRVQPWSDEHYRRIGESFQWIAQVGSQVILLPLTAEGEYGNEQSMVLWVKQPDGSYKHDFTRVEKYLDVALKHIPRPRFVAVGVWHFSEHNRNGVFSELDPATGKITLATKPRHGTPEALAFWKPVLTKMRQVLAARGLEKSMILGFGSDRYPAKATVGVFHEILPDVGWMAPRHPPNGGEYMDYDGGRVPVMYTSNVWGCGDVPDPSVGRRYGWNFKYPVEGGLRTWLDRGAYDPDTLTRFRCMSEGILMSDRPGQGQIGADFWPPEPQKGQRPLTTLFSRFPRSANVGAGNKGCTTNQLLHPDGGKAAPTVRFEMIRENIEECEARIFLEKLLTAKPCPLEEALARKGQDLLDERARWHRVSGIAADCAASWPYSGWEDRTRRLYEIAAEAAKAVKTK